MPRHNGDLGWRQLAIERLGELLAFLLQARDLFRDIQHGVILNKTEFFYLVLELGNRLLKIEKGRLH
ncbi:hypothetical protein D3C85_1611170 [compost metagenome]